MVTAAFEDERRRRAKALRDDLMAGAGMISGGVAAFGAGQDKKKATDAAQANVDADNARADAAETRASDMAKAAAEERKLAAADRTAAAEVLRKKGEAAEAAVLRKKKIDDAKAARDTLLERARGGASFESVRNAASEDEALGEWDDSNVQSLYDEVAREKAERAAKEADAKQKTRKTESEISRNEAAATKALRAPAGPKPVDPQKKRILDLTEKKLIQDIEGTRPQPPSDVQRRQKDKVTALEGDVNALDEKVKKVMSGLDPGVATGRIRGIYSDLFGDAAWSEFEASAAAVNSQVFGLLRSDAPSESETKMIGRLQIKPTDNPTSLASKIATIRALIAARSANPNAPLDQLGVKVPGGTAAAAPKALTPVPAAENAEAEAATDEELEALAKGG